MKMQRPYSSGNWNVKAGCEKQFIERWTDFLSWTRSAFSELESAALIQDDEDSVHFVSFASWKNADAMKAWRSRPEFTEKLSACRALCNDFRGANYSVAALL